MMHNQIHISVIPELRSNIRDPLAANHGARPGPRPGARQQGRSSPFKPAAPLNGSRLSLRSAGMTVGVTA
jgi:hypothetical protein